MPIPPISVRAEKTENFHDVHASHEACHSASRGMCAAGIAPPSSPPRAFPTAMASCTRRTFCAPPPLHMCCLQEACRQACIPPLCASAARKPLADFTLSCARFHHHRACMAGKANEDTTKLICARPLKSPRFLPPDSRSPTNPESHLTVAFRIFLRSSFAHFLV